MSNRDNDVLKNRLLANRIELSDTLTQFVEKCNNNFAAIIEWGGGPNGADGEKGEQGVPAKPKVPIHIWREGVEYNREYPTSDESCPYIIEYTDDLSNPKYQDGHLIMLKNGHVYILETEYFNLIPKYIISLQSYDPDSIVNGKNAYVHFAYAYDTDSYEGFITAQELHGNNETEAVSTFSLRRGVSESISDVNDRPYMGVYSNDDPVSSILPSAYTWVRIQGTVGADGAQGPAGPQGPQGPAGPQGDPGDAYTGQPYAIDLEGDMSTISIDIDRTRLYDDSEDYCECTLHAYYGNENVKIDSNDVEIVLPNDYTISNNEIVSKYDGNKVGQIEKSQSGNDVIIKFIPDETFIFPKKTITFNIHVDTEITDDNDGKTYRFVRDTVWMIKGIMSTFELEITPQYRTIKLFEDGKYYPENLFVYVYKIEDGERSLFNFAQNPNFTLLYKNYDDNNNEWKEYDDENGVCTVGVSCLEFKIVRRDAEKPEEIWDYEDVWVVADGKSTHYYYADLGDVESMMVFTSGEKYNIETNEDSDPKYCAKLIDELGYSITLDPKFFDGSNECEVTGVTIYSNNNDVYYLDGTFEREIKHEDVDGSTKYTLIVTKVPADVKMIPMNIRVEANCPSEDDPNKFVTKSDTVSFNVYISTISNKYTLSPTVSAFNTSTAKDGDMIGCNVYKNNTLIPTLDLDLNGLSLKYAIHNSDGTTLNYIDYTEPILYGDDSDIDEDEFTASDVAIEFVLYYANEEIVRSTVPLIKDGVDGRDGDSWQYIFCRSPRYPFKSTGISNPSEWEDPNANDSNSEFILTDEWYDDHKGVDSIYKYEYQSYRKWDKDNSCWGKYGEPTLYSNYSESGSGYSVMLSNPIAVIPVGDGESDWSVDENLENQGDSTLVYLYNNTSDMSKNPNVTISIVDNIHFSITTENGVNKVVFTPVVDGVAFDFGSNNQYKLPITLTYSLGDDADGDSTVDNFSSTINWTLSPIKGLSDVEVFVDKKVIKTTTSPKHSLKVGYYLIPSNGSKKFISDFNTDNDRGYKIILTDDIANLSNVVTNWENAEYNFVINGKNRNCYVVLVESDGKTIVDYTNVTAINDGKSALHLELTQDYIALPCSANGNNVHPDYITPIRSRMMLYEGGDLIEDYNNIEYTFTIGDKSISVNDIFMIEDGVFEISKDIITGDTNITCTATYNNTSFHKTLFINLENTPYELEINKNTLTRDVNVGRILDDKLIVRVKYWMDGNWTYTDSGIVKLNTTNGRENLYFGDPDGDFYQRTLIITGSTLEKNDIDTEVRISYCEDNSEKELSYETIGIINGGRDGNIWQYIFSRSPLYPFDKTGISDPSTWSDPNNDDPNSKLLGHDGIQDNNWYEEHKGVDSIYKYEYQTYRKWDKENGCWGKYEKPTLYSNYSESGSGYSVMLSNPIAVIPVGTNDWSVDENLENQGDSTLVYLYNNTSDMSSNDNVTISLPDNEFVNKGYFSITKENDINKVVFTPVIDDVAFDFEFNAQYKLPITLIYDLGNNEDYFSTTVNWTLTPIKGLEDVEVFVDTVAVNTTTQTQHYFRVGYYLINDTKTFIGKYNEGNIKDYKIVLADSIDTVKNGGGELVTNWQKASYDFIQNGQKRNCYVALVESDGKTIVDYTSITSVNDGENGESAMHLELTQDHIAIPCSANGGSVHTDYKQPIESEMILYDGSKLVEDYNNITYSFKANNVTIGSDKITIKDKGIFEISKDIITGDTNIICTATYNNVSYNKTLFIDLENTPYELEINKNILTRDVNTGRIIDDLLTVSIKYWMNGNWVYTKEGVVKISSKNNTYNFGAADESSETYVRQFMFNAGPLEYNTEDIEFRISYHENTNTREISYETIGIVNGGKNGETVEPPTCESTEIVGYSLKEIDVNSNEWYDTLDGLISSLEPKQKIYIKNKYIWSNGDVSYGVTVTLAGTQGVEGKSRVLFYLGSFEDGTLEGTSVKGILNDERCDYYIDSDGIAWMRTGVEGEKDGSSDGNTDSLYWKVSTKVGFLQAGAIHADMINAGSITAESAIVGTIFSQEIVSSKLKVTEANIEGLLTADVIDATNLKVDAANIEGTLVTNSLETSPDTNEDKIFVKDNYINIISSNGYKNIRISSENISEDFEPENLYDNWYENPKGINFKSTSTILDIRYVSDTITTHSNNHKSFSTSMSSAMFNDGGVIKDVIVCLGITTDESKANLVGPSGGITTSGWGLSTNLTFCMRLYIYKIIDDEKGVRAEQVGQPYPITSLSTSIYPPWAVAPDMPGVPSYLYIANVSPNITLERGRYTLVLEIPERCITINGSATNAELSIQYRALIERNFNNYTEIGKNGLISKSNNCSLYMNDNVIQMVASTGGKGTAYGFKVTTEGIFYKNGTNIWTKWSPN